MSDRVNFMFVDVTLGNWRANFAAESADSLPGMFIWLGTHINVILMDSEAKLCRRIWIRCVMVLVGYRSVRVFSDERESEKSRNSVSVLGLGRLSMVCRHR